MPDTIDDAKEHPIIFNEWSINRILAGEKTQTRRVIDFSKFDPLGEMDMRPGKFEFEGLEDGRSANFCGPNGVAVVHCPYGQPGDVLWVREGFQFPEFEDDVSPRDLVDYWVDQAGAPPPVKYSTGETKRAWNGHDWGRKRSSIHMPRELCRIRLRVEDVRVERVQGMSPEDAYAEGVKAQTPSSEPRTAIQAQQMQDEAMIDAFREKWNSIHGDGAWERNEWVWVVEFSRTNE
jgi:hypothetical protein